MKTARRMADDEEEAEEEFACEESSERVLVES
jgi:hypothetical protein